MGFTTISFLLFLPMIVAFHHFASKQLRWLILLLGSYLFYAFYEPYLLLIILCVTTLAYGFGIMIYKHKSKAIQITGVIFVLSFLLFFKYTNFIIEIFYDLLDIFSTGIDNPADYSIVLPIGISFYTFQAIGYLVDIYRGKIEPERHYGYFSLFLVFFPQLVAGPIEKPNHLIPQLKQTQGLRWEAFSAGSKMILLGFFKKIVIANTLLPIVIIFYEKSIDTASAFEIWLILIAFAYYIYADFSGYCDIAIGVAMLFNVQLSPNFLKPFSSLNLREFWRKWHATLSSWISIYLFKAIGGIVIDNKLRTFFNVMLVFIIMGLWHGASYNFLMFGVFGGLFIVIDFSTKDWRRKLFKKINLTKKNRISRFIFRSAVVASFAFLGIFFNTKSISESFQVISRLGDFTFNWSLSLISVLIILSSVLVIELINHYTPKKEFHPFSSIKSDLVRISVYSLITVLISLFFFTSKIDFYYFQF